MNLYQEEILEHYKHPHNKKRLSQPSYSKDAVNPLCGDNLGLDLLVENGVITDVGFWGDGCAISQASMSLLSDTLINLPVKNLGKIHKETVLELLGVDVGPSRLKCALLPLSVIDKIVQELD